LTHLPLEDLEAIMSVTNALPADAAQAAKSASHILATLPTAARNDALTAIHSALSESKEEILAANARDLTLARKAAEDGQLSLSIVSRLDLGKKGKWEDMLKGILDVRALEDPGTVPFWLCRRNSNVKLCSWQSHVTNKT
jgi:glutamate-5-semialdehyde dehydrogenase